MEARKVEYLNRDMLAAYEEGYRAVVFFWEPGDDKKKIGLAFATTLLGAKAAAHDFVPRELDFKVCEIEKDGTVLFDPYECFKTKAK